MPWENKNRLFGCQPCHLCPSANFTREVKENLSLAFCFLCASRLSSSCTQSKIIRSSFTFFRTTEGGVGEFEENDRLSSSFLQTID
jgi:hypothetical protein